MTKLLRKFKFTDLSLAFKVRQNMFNALVQFDQNYNHKFQVNQIKQAMISLLKQDQMEIQYVIKNVFRYDTNGDNAVTYSQFTNFCVEQHFGEMAIQRLHRKGYYVNGNKRIMNVQEFSTTLDYCLDFINSKGTNEQYLKLFQEVDIDQDQAISYQDYFIFLKEYFGSHSQAFQQQERNPRPIPPRPQVVKVKIEASPVNIKIPDRIPGSFNGLTPYQAFAKLIYTQFKITVMDKDTNKNMNLQVTQIQNILTNSLKLNYQQQTKLKDKLLNCNNKRINSLTYDIFIKNCLVAYMSDFSISTYNCKSNINENQFVQLTSKSTHFVSIKPCQNLLRACFRQVSRGSSQITVNQYKTMMAQIFQAYKFDGRGLPQHRIDVKKTGGVYRF